MIVVQDCMVVVLTTLACLLLLAFVFAQPAGIVEAERCFANTMSGDRIAAIKRALEDSAIDTSNTDEVISFVLGYELSLIHI